MLVCMLGEHESSDALRGQIKKREGDSYAAEGRIKVNAPKLLLSERGHLSMQRHEWGLSLGREVWRRREYFVSERGDSEALPQHVSISGALGLLWSHFALHFQGKGDPGDKSPEHPAGSRPVSGAPWIPGYVG